MKARCLTLAVLGCTLWTTSAWAAPAVSITAPAANAGVGRGRTVDVSVTVTSGVTVKTVTGQVTGGPSFTVPPAMCTLTGTGVSCFAQIPTTGVPNGPATVTLAATDALDDVGTGTLAIVVDDAPTIQGVLPNSLVTSPSLALTCADTGAYACTSLEILRVETPLVSGTTSVSLPLGPLDGTGPDYQLVARARDAKGIETVVPLGLTVDLTPGVRVLSRVPGEILEVSEKSILFRKRDAGGLFLRDRATGVDTLLSLTGTEGKLLDQGALFYVSEDPAGPHYLWGTTRGSFAGVNPRTDGKRAVFAGSADYASPEAIHCYLVDFATGAVTTPVDLTTLASAPRACQGLGIAPSGDLYFSFDNFTGTGIVQDFVRVSGGVASRLNFAGSRHTTKILDGEHLAFDTTGAAASSNLYYDNVLLGVGYLFDARDGFVLFRGPNGSSNPVQVREPDNTLVDRNIFTLPNLGHLGPAGEFSVGARTGDATAQNLVPLTGRPTEVARGPGNLVPVAGGWLLVQADTLRCARAPCG
ncbi:MAG: hypothetical protein HOO96_03775, partial [Polyangiaceae bacterium]|nr:hypothetical protein [Polyangiaceae bacterium]